jgi:adenine phosphoribosyltransferase
MSSDPETLRRLHAGVRDVLDFPKAGIVFKDITPLLADAQLFKLAVDTFVDACAGLKPDKIVGIDARGFLFASAVAYQLGVGFVPVRKKGKLPFKTEAIAYSLEYGEASIEMHIDAILGGEKVVLIDDLLATGGTSGAAIQLIRKAGGDLLSAQFLIELEFLHGRKNLPDGVAVESFLKY